MPPPFHPIQTNFTAGEVSPFLFGRSDIDKYKNALAICENFIPYQQGPLLRRSGTRFVANTMVNNFTMVLPFYATEDENFALEVGHEKIKAFKEGVPWGSPTEVSVPAFQQAILPALDYDQSSDILYVCTAGVTPPILISKSATGFVAGEFVFFDGPYEDENLDITKTLSLTSGSIAAGATATFTLTGVVLDTNDSSDIAGSTRGRHFRLRDESNKIVWGRLKTITPSGGNTVIVVSWEGGVFSGFTFAPAMAHKWRLGVFSRTLGFPQKLAFYEERMVFGNTWLYPDGVWFSKAKDYALFSPTEFDLIVTDANAFSVYLPSTKLNEITSMTNSSGFLLVNTLSNEWAIEGTSGPITPKNIKVDKTSTTGSRQLTKALKIDNTIFFLHRSGQRLLEYGFRYEEDSFRPEDATLLSEHILKKGNTHGEWIDFQQIPNKILWIIRDDGQLVSLTYNRTQSVYGWSRHILGGGGQVEDIVILPSATRASDLIYLVVKRGSSRTIEIMEEDFLPDNPQDKHGAFFVDCGVTFQWNPSSPMPQTVNLTSLLPAVTHGKTVSVLIDGAVYPSTVVTSSYTIPKYPFSVFTIGLPYESKIRLLEIEGGKENGTAQGKIKRLTHLTLRLKDSLGFSYNIEGGTPILHSFRSTQGQMDVSPDLFTGDVRIPLSSSYSSSNRIEISQTQPYPLTIVAVMPELTVQQ